MVSLWHWYSIDQLYSATYFANSAEGLEAAPPAPNEEEATRGLLAAEGAIRQHRSYVVASVFASAALLEAVVNEVVLSSADGSLQVGGRLSQLERSRLTSTADSLDRIGLLDRVQTILRMLDRQAFDRGAQPFRDASLLVQFRNALVHYKPRWRAGGADETFSGFETALHSKGLAENPFSAPGNPFFPDRCMSSSHAWWARDSAKALADDFHARLGVEPVYGVAFEIPI